MINVIISAATVAELGERGCHAAGLTDPNSVTPFSKIAGTRPTAAVMSEFGTGAWIIRRRVLNWKL